MIYRCYDRKLMWYLVDRGVRYELIARDIVTGAVFYVFMKTEQLSKLIKEYRESDEKE